MNGDAPFFRVPFLSRFRIYGCHLASSGFLGAILSPLRIYGYTFEKNCLKIIFPAFLMLDTVVSALRGPRFPDLWVSFFGSAAGFIGAKFMQDVTALI